MKSSVIINGMDIGDLGMFILRDGDYGFLPFPERKQPPTNSWFEYDGVDVDLTEVFFKERVLTVHFYISASSPMYYEFYLNEFYKLITSGYIELYSREFDRTFTLRYLNCPELEHRGGLYKSNKKSSRFKVEFSMDAPLQLFTNPTILQPRSIYKHTTRASLNGIDLGNFGIIVNECYSSLLKLSAIKAPLTRSFALRTGLQAYPRSNPTFEPRELVIKCTMRAGSRAEFYYNYEALFNQINKPEALIFSSFLGDEECYYSNMADFKKLEIFSRRAMVQFTLHFVLLNAGITTFILGTEDGSALLTEDGEYIEITR